jgi:hypothetical protein
MDRHVGPADSVKSLEERVMKGDVDVLMVIIFGTTHV